RDGAQEMQQHDSALAFPQVAARLLSIEVLVGFQVKQVVVDLKGDTGQKAQLDELRQLVFLGGQRAGRRAADDSNSKRSDHGVPAGLLVSHADVIAVAE